jgi:thioredoxin reductase (NADPH)
MASKETPILDLAIIGSGPAALTAAIYCAREHLNVAVFEKTTMGGLAGTISEIENFPGFSGTGAELMSTMEKQAISFGARVDYGECLSVKKKSKNFILSIDGEEVHARSILIATGSERRKLGIPGEDNLTGISYCATCDGPLFEGKEVIVVGGGNSALQETFFLLDFVPRVTIINRSKLRATEVLKARARKEKRITIMEDTPQLEFVGKNGKFTGLKVNHQGKEQIISADGCFVFIGMQPATIFLEGSGVSLSQDGSIKTDSSYMTNVPGIFAAGDVRSNAVKQAIVAAGEGAAAAVNIGKYLKDL